MTSSRNSASVQEQKQDLSCDIKLLERMVKEGNIEAQALLGNNYYLGYQVAKDEKRGKELLLSAAQFQNTIHTPCEILLPHIWAYGKCLEYNFIQEANLDSRKRAFYWIERAANRGYAPAQKTLGDYYLDGAGVEKSPNKAMEWYEKAAAQSYASAQNMMGYCYSRGCGVTQDKNQEKVCYEKAAGFGFVVAQYNLAIFYENAWGGLKKDTKAAIQLNIAAARQGYLPAREKLGKYFLEGKILEESDQKAVEQYAIFGEQNQSLQYAEAAYRLSRSFEVNRMVAEKIRWRQKAAEKGHLQSLYDVGEWYEKGIKLKKDQKAAFSNYMKAAKQKHQEAQFGLGRCFVEGLGLGINISEKNNSNKKDVEKYAIFKQNNHEYQYPEALYKIGKGYELKKQKEQAIQWHKESASKKFAPAQYALAKIYRSQNNNIWALKRYLKAAEIDRNLITPDDLRWCEQILCKYKKSDKNKLFQQLLKVDPNAFYELAKYYKSNNEKIFALSYYLKAAECNRNTVTREDLNWCEQILPGNKSSDEGKLLTKLSNIDPIALLEYRLGMHIVRNHNNKNASYFWFNRARKRNFDLARFRYANCLVRGVGTRVNENLAKNIYIFLATKYSVEDTLDFLCHYYKYGTHSARSIITTKVLSFGREFLSKFLKGCFIIFSPKDDTELSEFLLELINKLLQHDENGNKTVSKKGQGIISLILQDLPEYNERLTLLLKHLRKEKNINFYGDNPDVQFAKKSSQKNPRKRVRVAPQQPSQNNRKKTGTPGNNQNRSNASEEKEEEATGKRALKYASSVNDRNPHHIHNIANKSKSTKEMLNWQVPQPIEKKSAEEIQDDGKKSATNPIKKKPQPRKPAPIADDRKYKSDSDAASASRDSDWDSEEDDNTKKLPSSQRIFCWERKLDEKNIRAINQNKFVVHWRGRHFFRAGANKLSRTERHEIRRNMINFDKIIPAIEFDSLAVQELSGVKTLSNDSKVVATQIQQREQARKTVLEQLQKIHDQKQYTSESKRIYKSRYPFHQQLYSNSYDKYHAYLEDEQKKLIFNFSFTKNPHASTTDLAVHALRYASGQKVSGNNLPNRLRPRYRSSGRAKYPHVGIVYAIVHICTSLPNDPNNHVVSMHANDEVDIDARIVSERETSFLSSIANPEMIFAKVVKIPSFIADYKVEFADKYGISENEYQKFRNSVCATTRGTPEHKKIKNEIINKVLHYTQTLLLKEIRNKLGKNNQVYRNIWGGYGNSFPIMLFVRLYKLITKMTNFPAIFNNDFLRLFTSNTLNARKNADYALLIRMLRRIKKHPRVVAVLKGRFTNLQKQASNITDTIAKQRALQKIQAIKELLGFYDQQKAVINKILEDEQARIVKENFDKFSQVFIEHFWKQPNAIWQGLSNDEVQLFKDLRSALRDQATKQVAGIDNIEDCKKKIFYTLLSSVIENFTFCPNLDIKNYAKLITVKAQINNLYTPADSETEKANKILLLAICSANLELIDKAILLTASKVDLSFKDNLGNTFLHYAVMTKQLAVVKKIHNMHVADSADHINFFGFSAVHIAAALGLFEIVRGIISYKKLKVDIPTAQGRNLIDLVIKSGNQVGLIDIICDLILRGCNVTDELFNEYKDNTTFGFLIKNVYEINTRIEDLVSPTKTDSIDRLQPNYCYNKVFEFFRALVNDTKFGVFYKNIIRNYSLIDFGGRRNNFYYNLVCVGEYEMLKFLFEQCELDAGDSRDRFYKAAGHYQKSQSTYYSPLSQASQIGNLDLTKLILANFCRNKKESKKNYKIFVNQINSDGLTALHLAIINRHPQIIKLLLEKQADCTIEFTDEGDHQNRNALNAAKKYFPDPEIIKLIEQKYRQQHDEQQKQMQEEQKQSTSASASSSTSSAASASAPAFLHAPVSEPFESIENSGLTKNNKRKLEVSTSDSDYENDDGEADDEGEVSSPLAKQVEDDDNQPQQKIESKESKEVKQQAPIVNDEPDIHIDPPSADIEMDQWSTGKFEAAQDNDIEMLSRMPLSFFPSSTSSVSSSSLSSFTPGSSSSCSSVYASSSFSGNRNAFFQPAADKKIEQFPPAPAPVLPLTSPAITNEVDSKSSTIQSQIEIQDGKSVSKIYWYEDHEIKRILEYKIAQEYHNQTKDQKPIYILGPLDNVSPSGLFETLTEHKRQPGVVLIPFNLWSLHWVGLILEYNNSGSLIQADYYDSQGGQVETDLLDAILDAHAKDARDVKQFTAQNDAKLVRQTNGCDCGPCTIENLLTGAGVGYVDPTANDPVGRRLRHIHILENAGLEGVEQKNFSDDFYNRQRLNQSSFSQAAHSKNNQTTGNLIPTGNFTFKEYQALMGLVSNILQLKDDGVKKKLIAALKPSEAKINEHEDQINNIRETFNSVIANQDVLPIIKQFFFLAKTSDLKLKIDITALKNAPLKLNYNQIPLLYTLLTALTSEEVKRNLEELAKLVPNEVVPTITMML